jgi:hypothetical protein
VVGDTDIGISIGWELLNENAPGLSNEFGIDELLDTEFGPDEIIITS